MTREEIIKALELLPEDRDRLEDKGLSGYLQMLRNRNARLGYDPESYIPSGALGIGCCGE